MVRVYKNIWMINLHIKLLWEYLSLNYFWRESQNVNTFQVYEDLKAQFLKEVVRDKSAVKKSFANLFKIIQLHLSKYVKLQHFNIDTYKAWKKSHNDPIAFVT